MALYEQFEQNPMQTKQDFQQLVLDLYCPLARHQSDAGAVCDLEEGAAFYDMQSSYIEAVARPLWAIVPLVAGGGHFPYWDNIAKAIIAGTDPQHSEYWGETRDMNQRSVEMGAFGFMLMFTPEPIQQRLSQPQLERFAEWLAKIQSVELPPTNWLFFAVMVQEGLKNVGFEHYVDHACEGAFLDKLTNMYRGDGWYGDGDPKAIDHYGGFALHVYGLLYAIKNPTSAYSQLFIERAETFADQFKYWFSDTGEAMMVGRSLTYRFAMNAYWGALAAAEMSPIPVGQIKSLWMNQLRSWKGKPIFTSDGVMTRGYYYSNLQLSEQYNSPTSPYWAMKAFLPLMLSDDAQFWTTVPEAVEYETSIKAMPTAQHIVQRIDGLSIAHYAAPIHQWLQLDKYNKFAYSTHFGMDVASLLYAQTNSFGDNLLAFSDDGGDNWRMKNHNLSTQIKGNVLVSRWQSGFTQVETQIEIDERGFCTRTHEFELTLPTIIVESTFALDQWKQTSEVFSVGDGKFVVNKGQNLLSSNDDANVQGASIFAKNSNGLVGVLSCDEHEKVACVCNRTNSNVTSPQTIVPFLKMTLGAGKHKLVTRHFASLNPEFPIEQ